MSETFPVVMISGTDEYRRRKTLHTFREGMLKDGFQVSRVDGKNYDRLATAVSGSVLFESRELVIVDNPDQVDLDLVLNHYHDPQPGVTIALYYEGTPKRGGTFAKLAKIIPPSLHLSFSLPPFYKMAEEAARMCVLEARERGVQLSDPLAASMVDVVGTNLGMLSWEVYKVSLLLEAEGKTEVTSEHLRASLSQIDNVGVGRLNDYVGLASVRKVCRQLRWIEKTHPGDSTMMVVRFMFPSVSQWMVVADLHEKGVPQEDAALALNMNSWFHKRKVLPVAKRWGRKKLFHLLGVLQSAERGVLSGDVSPWLGLCSGLMRVCGEIGKRKS